MKRVGKNSIALGMVIALVSLALSFSANGAAAPVSQAKSAAVTSNGLTQIISGTPCEGTFPDGKPTGQCGEGLDTTGVDAYSQHVTVTKDGTSSAKAGVAPINIVPLGPSLDLTDLLSSVRKIDTGTVLDAVVKGLDPALALLVTGPLKALVTPIDDALQTALGTLDKSLPVSLQVGTVEAECSADQKSAKGSSVVAPLHLNIQLGGQAINVPITLSTTPNSDLVVGSDEAAQQLAAGLVDGLKATLETTLGGALSPLTVALDQIKAAIVTQVLDTLEPSLLTPLGNAIKPLLSGTVNEQKTSAGAIEVTALHLNLLNGANDLKLATVSCGPNRAADKPTPKPTPPPSDNANANANANVNANAIANANANANAGQVDANVTSALPATGAPNVLPLLLLALGLIGFGTAVLANEKRRFAAK